MHEDGLTFYWNNATHDDARGVHRLAVGQRARDRARVRVPRRSRSSSARSCASGIASYCLPVIAIGPILQIVFNGQTPKIILAALSVFFTTLVGMLVGLRSADKTTLDLIHAYGGGAFKKLTKVRLRAALPSLFAALRIAAPAAILGAIIGEYLGAEHGPRRRDDQLASRRSRSSGRGRIALVATALAGVAYGITALVGPAGSRRGPRRSGRAMTASIDVAIRSPIAPPPAWRGAARAGSRAGAASAAGSLSVGDLARSGARRVAAVPHRVPRQQLHRATPLDVWRYLTDERHRAADRPRGSSTTRRSRRSATPFVGSRRRHRRRARVRDRVQPAPLRRADVHADRDGAALGAARRDDAADRARSSAAGSWASP